MNNLFECISFNLDIFLINTSVFLFGYKVFLSNSKKIKDESKNELEKEKIGKPFFLTKTFYFEGDSPDKNIIISIECKCQWISLPHDILIVYHHDTELLYQSIIYDSQLVYHLWHWNCLPHDFEKVYHFVA